MGDESRKSEQVIPNILEFLSLPNEEGRCLLHFAASLGISQMVEMLVKVDPTKETINRQDKDGWAPIHLASKKGHPNIIRFLVANGADVNLTDGNDRTALHHAVANNHSKAAESLISLGANINAQDKIGFTPLHRAAGKGYVDLCYILIKAGAKIDALDKSGDTPLAFAVNCKQKEAAVYLIQKAAECFKLDESNEELQSIHSILARAPKDLADAILRALSEE